MPAIQVVLFDLGGTLLHYEQLPDKPIEQVNSAALQALVKAAVQAGGKVPDVGLAIRAVGRMGAAMEARARRTHLANTAETIIQEGLEAVGVRLPPNAWDAAIAAYYASISAGVTPAAGDAPAVLARLTQQGRGLGLVSNTFWAPALHDSDLARFGLLDYLPVRVYSCAVGITKPHPAIYRQALDALDVAPAEAVFVGDRLDVDVAGPQKIGMRAVLLVNPHQVEEDPEVVPDAQIHTLEELPPLLEEWERAMEPIVP